MREDVEVFQILQSIGALLRYGHFRYSSGKHGSDYISHKAIFQNPREARQLGFLLANHLHTVVDLPDAVMGPHEGGAFLAQKVAEHLSFMRGRNILALSALKRCAQCSGDGFYISEDTKILLDGRRVAVVDDIGNSGDSVRSVINLIQLAGGEVVSIGYLVNRGKLKQEDFGVSKFISLLDFPLDAWDAPCELCKSGVPINTRFGHGGDPPFHIPKGDF